MFASSRSVAAGLTCASLLLSLFAPACGGDGGSGGAGAGSGTGGSGDGKYHPPPNGTHISEEAACEALTSKQEKRLLELHCVGTGQTCPSFLRSQFQTPCMEYDEGSVQGCLDYYSKQASCQSLKDAIDTCAVTPYPGTEPAGCPMTSGTGGSTTSTGGTGGTGGSTTSTGGAGGSMTGSGGSTTGTGGSMTGSGGATTSTGTGGATTGAGGSTSSGM